MHYLWTTVVYCDLRIMTCIFLLQKNINGFMNVNQESAPPTDPPVYRITRWISLFSLFCSSKEGRGTVASTPGVMSGCLLISGGSYSYWLEVDYISPLACLSHEKLLDHLKRVVGSSVR